MLCRPCREALHAGCEHPATCPCQHRDASPTAQFVMAALARQRELSHRLEPLEPQATHTV